MKKKKVILSYDYELFFGDRSGTVQKSLIEPTNQLLDAMDSVGFKGNFFIDWQMLKYLSLEEDERCKRDHAAIVNQLKDMVRRGHRIELHIHPHWVDAKYNGDGTWNFDEFRHYSLNSFSKDEITEMFVEGSNLLESIAREVEPDYKIIAFRAGGWAVQPFEMLKEGFIKAGIKIDSSPSPGFYIVNIHSTCDFRDMPNRTLYRFENDVCKEDVAGEFICIPITSYMRHIIQGAIEKITRKYTRRLRYMCDGTHNRKEDELALKNGTLKQHSHSIRMLSFFTTPLCVPFIFYQLRKKDLICVLQHPKDHTSYTCSVLKTFALFSNSLTYNDIYNGKW